MPKSAREQASLSVEHAKQLLEREVGAVTGEHYGQMIDNMLEAMDFAPEDVAVLTLAAHLFRKQRT